MTKKKTKILFYGDGPQVATGFGTVTRNILVPLYNTGKYDIEVLGINYWGEPHEFPFPTWPVGTNPDRDPYGRKQVQERILSMEFDILFMIQDSFILEFIKDLVPKLKMNNKKFRSVVYFPIDGIPKPSWVEAMSEADYPVTYTEFGKKECVKAFPPIANKLKVIPHGANVNDFYPLNYGEIMSFREAFFGPLSEQFIVTMVNRNQQRKDIPRALMAFKEFKKTCPDSFMYLHMAVRDMGWNLDEVCAALGLAINKDVVFPHNFGPNKGFPINVLNKIYNASDVVVSSTTGEGWGLAQVEAMAAKVPVLSPDNTACTEILADGRGVLVKSGHTLDHHIIMTHDNEVIRPVISIPDMAKKLSILYHDEIARMKYAETGYEWVHNNWVWEKNIVPKWIDVIEEAVENLNTEESDEYSFSGAMEV